MASAPLQDASSRAGSYRALGSGAKINADPTAGLTTQEAKTLLLEHGPNELEAAAKEPFISILIAQMMNLIFLLTSVASFICYATGDNVKGTFLVCLVVIVCFVNALGEYTGQDAGSALKDMDAKEALVFRDGSSEAKQVPVAEIVPGDVVEIRSGSVVPADMEIIVCNDVQVDEGTLTGEAKEVHKFTKANVPNESGEEKLTKAYCLYKSTCVVSGKGKGIVLATGMKTQVGLIAKRLKDPDENDKGRTKDGDVKVDKAMREIRLNPLQVSINRLGTLIAICCGIVIFIGTVAGYFLGYQNVPPECSQTDRACLAYGSAVRGLLMAIAIIPHGLPLVVMIMLRVGSQLMYAKNALVMKQSAVDYLGAAQVICSDKTGTLTVGVMAVKKFVGILRSDRTSQGQGVNVSFYPLEGLNPRGGVFPSSKLRAEDEQLLDSGAAQPDLLPGVPNLADSRKEDAATNGRRLSTGCLLRSRSAEQLGVGARRPGGSLCRRVSAAADGLQALDLQQVAVAPSNGSSIPRSTVSFLPQRASVYMNGDRGAESESSNTTPRRAIQKITRQVGSVLISNVGQRPSMALQLMIENPRDINEVYHVAKKALGQGAFGTVKRTKVRATNAIRAVKCIEKGAIPDSLGGTNMLKTEIKITKMVDHPHIVKLYEIFEDILNLYLVMELCYGGTLLKQTEFLGCLNEDKSAICMQQILFAVLYLHNTLICHRDLKPENVLLLNSGALEKTSLKLTDFGVSCKFKPNQVLKARVGTVAFMAPEIIKKSYDCQCDMWSCGVMLYYLMCGVVPFSGRSDSDIQKNICAGYFSFAQSGWVDASQDAMDVVNGLLCMNPVLRLDARKALKHKWFHEHVLDDNRPVAMRIFQRLCYFKEQSKFVRASFCLVASLLSVEQLSKPSEAFHLLDKDGDGIVTVADMRAKLNAMIAKKGATTKDKSAAREMLREVGNSQLEKNNSNYTYTEFLAATFDRQKYLEEGVCKAAFTYFDQDCDGFVTLEELASGSLLGDMNTKELKKLVEDVDTNGDGEIDLAEFIVVMRRAP